MSIDPSLPLPNGSYRPGGKRLVLLACFMTVLAAALLWVLYLSLKTPQPSGPAGPIILGIIAAVCVAMAFALWSSLARVRLVVDEQGLAMSGERLYWDQPIQVFVVPETTLLRNSHNPTRVLPNTVVYPALILTDGGGTVRLRLIGNAWPRELLDALNLRLASQHGVRGMVIDGQIPLGTLRMQTTATPESLRALIV